MDFKSVPKQVYNSNRRSIKNHQNSTYQPPSFPGTTATGFPLLAIAIACITAITFLLLSYFLITKCCYPLSKFLTSRTTATTEEPPSVYSTPMWQITGLDESLIRQIPMCLYNKSDSEKKSLHKCVVCLNEFQDLDTLRVLPSCNHGFHLQCIDVWLRNNPNCPICRLNISGTTRGPIVSDTIGPNSSPQDPGSSPDNSSEDFVTIELGEAANESRKPHLMEMKDEQVAIQLFRRSFSMDSAVDRDVYLSVQDIIRNHEEAIRTKRPFFSFKHVRGPRSAILPLEF